MIGLLSTPPYGWLALIVVAIVCEMRGFTDDAERSWFVASAAMSTTVLGSAAFVTLIYALSIGKG